MTAPSALIAAPPTPLLRSTLVTLAVMTPEPPLGCGLDYVWQSDALALCNAVRPGSIDMIFTDPPYNRASIGCYEILAEGAARALKDGGFCLAMSGGLYNDEIMAGMAKHLTYYWTFHVYLSDKNTSAVHPGGNHQPIVSRVKPIHAFVKGWGNPRTVIYDPFQGSGNDKRFHHWGQDPVLSTLLHRLLYTARGIGFGSVLRRWHDALRLPGYRAPVRCGRSGPGPAWK